jgi:hypothetical protein
MAYASQAGRARTSPTNPQAHAICDRCGFRYNWVDLKWQYDWRGAAMQNIRILVCNTCYDTPQEQLRAIVVPADPTPIVNARVQDFALAETDNLTVSAPTVYDPTTGIPIPSTTNIVTEDGDNLNTQVIGIPTGLDANSVMPLNGTTHYRVPVPFLSVSSVGTTIITVTCTSPHNLKTNDQVSVLGLTNTGAEGFYSVTVTTATAFTYTTNNPIPAGSLLSSTTIITVSAGLPYGYIGIPKTGIPGN